MRTVSIALASFLVAACGAEVGGPDSEWVDDEQSDTDTGDNGGDNGVEDPPEVPAEPQPCQKMDIVFVVDDSGSMSEEQSNLASNFPVFFDLIDNYTTETGEPLDYRIAVTTGGRDVDYTVKLPPPFGADLPMSENGDNGAFRKTDSMTRRWLERGDSDIKSEFSQLAQVGTGGPSLEMPLYSMELAMTERMADGTNGTFRRDDALLAFVIVTDEDDCSRTDNDFEIENDQCGSDDPTYVGIPEYVEFFNNYTGAPGRWATAVVAGETSCSSSFGDAIEAERLQDFVGMSGSNGVFSSICDGDLASALIDALDTFDAACEYFPPVD